MKQSLIYVHDPMCSWCWVFEPVHRQLFTAVKFQMPQVQIVRLVGGLAPDSNEPMAPQMQAMLQSTWRKIAETIPGTEFNFDFWTECQPRPSTFPANRAVLAARLLGGDSTGSEYDEAMTYRIGKAYYTEARNPSDNTMLIELAEDIGLDVKRFEQDLLSEQVQAQLLEEHSLARQLGMSSFPSLIYQDGQQLYPVELDYNNAEAMLVQIINYIELYE